MFFGGVWLGLKQVAERRSDQRFPLCSFTQCTAAAELCRTDGKVSSMLSIWQYMYTTGYSVSVNKLLLEK